MTNITGISECVGVCVCVDVLIALPWHSRRWCMWQALWGLDAELVDNLVYELSVCCRMTIYHKWSLKTSITWIIDEVRHFERPLLYYLRWKDGTNFEPMSKLFSTKVFSDFWYFVLCMFYDPFSKILGCNSIPYLRDGKRAYYLVRSPMKFWKIDTCNWHTELAFT